MEVNGKERNQAKKIHENDGLKEQRAVGDRRHTLHDAMHDEKLRALVLDQGSPTEDLRGRA